MERWGPVLRNIRWGHKLPEGRTPSLAADESDLIAQSQRGDKEAFAVLVERYTGVLFGTAYLMTRDRSLAEEMVQEALLLAWRAIPGFRKGGNFKAWMVRILVNRTMSERRKRRVMTVYVKEGLEPGADPQRTEELVLEEAERDLIRRAMEELPQEQRELLVLRYYSDLSIREIARALGCREGTVKSRLHRALARLRDILNQQGLGSPTVPDSGGGG